MVKFKLPAIELDVADIVDDIISCVDTLDTTLLVSVIMQSSNDNDNRKQATLEQRNAPVVSREH